jgi:3-deoxy-D-manno-octulosonic-acid transferase
MSLRFYQFAAAAASLAAPAWLRARALRGKEDPARWPERLGLAAPARPKGRIAWLHGVSVGESLSLLPLAGRIREERPDVAVLVTSGTRAAADLLAARLPQGMVHQYAPLDTPGAVRRFLAHWTPELGVLVESELWPNLILAAHAHGVRLALVSAKLSARSLDGWRLAPGAARAVLGAFHLVLARDAAASERLESLGARVDGLADLKFAAQPLPADQAELGRARSLLRGRPVLLAASTHPGEEVLILRALKALSGDDPPLLILAPRHPVRGEAIYDLARAAGFAAGRRGAADPFGDSPVYVADTVGELGLWYRLANLAVIGGSLITEAAKGVGGHNPLEPARLGCPFISGPNVAAWPVYGALQAAGATRLVPAPDLAAWFARALASDSALAAMAARARAFAAAGDAAAAAAADRVLDLLPGSSEGQGNPDGGKAPS